MPFDEKEWLAGPAASRPPTGEAGFSTLERVGARPTAEVNGMWGGYTGPGHKTIVPAEAHAKVSFRLVADQRPEDVGPQVRAWVEANLPDGHRRPRCTPRPAASSPVRQRPRLAGHGRPARARSPRPGTASPATCCTSGRAAAGRRPTWSTCSVRRCCSSAPGCPTDRIHSPNERVLLSMLYRGAEAAAHLWRELGQVQLR